MKSTRICFERVLHRCDTLSFILAFLLIALTITDHTDTSPTLLPALHHPYPSRHLQHRPLIFEQNLGQVAEEVRYISRATGYDLFLLENEVMINLKSCRDQATLVQYPVKMKLANAQPNPDVRGQNRLKGKTNYLLGNDKDKWRQGIPIFEKVRYREVYPGIDLFYYGSQDRIE